MESFALTDTGLQRKMNQDFVLCMQNQVANLPNLFIVADGMGGHNAGDFASRFCVENVVKIISKSKEVLPVRIFEQAIQTTNSLLIKEASKNEHLEGMGTTFVMATIQKNKMYIANIGDSRLYLIRDNCIRQITRDHSLVEEMVMNGEIKREEAKFHPNKNIITRALGASVQVVPDYFEVSLQKEDMVVMCSDGLSNMLDDEEIREIVTTHRGDIKQAVHVLIAKANENGGKDNITAIVLKL